MPTNADITADPLKQQPLTIRWREYFQRFCEAHGRWPVQYMGRLLFRDGWMYSSSDYKGPEWAPPEDPLNLLRLRHIYWTRRRSIVADEHERLITTARVLADSQAARSARLPIYQTARYQETDEDGRPRTISKQVEADLGALQGRIDWLQEDLDVCDKEIKAIGTESI